mmetsp:Transcript_12314/g.30121  ORF Transcript_12314/g.30121 Transcript_12314/m.30121 type:complete len:215 (-) Transcript_12314:327-971(-)
MQNMHSTVTHTQRIQRLPATPAACHQPSSITVDPTYQPLWSGLHATDQRAKQCTTAKRYNKYTTASCSTQPVHPAVHPAQTRLRHACNVPLFNENPLPALQLGPALPLLAHSTHSLHSFTQMVRAHPCLPGASTAHHSSLTGYCTLEWSCSPTPPTGTWMSHRAHAPHHCVLTQLCMSVLPHSLTGSSQHQQAGQTRTRCKQKCHTTGAHMCTD